MNCRYVPLTLSKISSPKGLPNLEGGSRWALGQSQSGSRDPSPGIPPGILDPGSSQTQLLIVSKKREAVLSAPGQMHQLYKKINTNGSPLRKMRVWLVITMSSFLSPKPWYGHTSIAVILSVTPYFQCGTKSWFCRKLDPELRRCVRQHKTTWGGWGHDGYQDWDIGVGWGHVK
jgi:hypothetical protein